MRYGILSGFLITVGVAAACAVSGGSGPTEAPVTAERKVVTDDVTLHMKTANMEDGKAVLIAIHGGPGMSSDYMTSLEQLAGDQLTVVRYDQRGTGRSSVPPPQITNYTLDRYVADLDAIRLATGRDKVHLFGHSWGGIVALRYATTYPERVESVILMGSGPPNRQAMTEGELQMARVRSELQNQGVIPQRIQSVNDVIPAYFSDPELVVPQELQDLHYSPVAEQLTREALGDYGFVDQVGQLEHRVLLLFGADDAFGTQMAEATRNALSRADVEFILLEGCGHFWHECPEPFFRHLRDFLQLP